MVEFHLDTKMPKRIDVFSESEGSIETTGHNAFVRIASLEWQCVGTGTRFSSPSGVFFGPIASFLQNGLKEGIYDECVIKLDDMEWKVKSIRAVIQANKREAK